MGYYRRRTPQGDEYYFAAQLTSKPQNVYIEDVPERSAPQPPPPQRPPEPGIVEKWESQMRQTNLNTALNRLASEAARASAATSAPQPKPEQPKVRIINPFNPVV